MKELNSKERRAGLGFADRLAEMAANAPDEITKQIVYRAVNACRHRFGFSEREKVEMVFEAIALGASMISDLVRETGFPPQFVHEAVKLLESHKAIKIGKLSIARTGRPALVVSLVAEKEK